MDLVTTLRPLVTTSQLVAFVIVIIRLFSAGLNRTYFWFTAYICYEALRLASFGFMHSGTKLYGYIYFFTQPVTWCLFLLVILELYQLVLKDHAGIATFARRALLIALSVSTVVSVATLTVEVQEPNFNVLRTYVLVERLILSSLLLFLLLFTAFLAYFPVPVNRNMMVHTRVFACFFLFKTVLLIFRNVIPVDSQKSTIINLILQLLATACLLAWAALLGPAGERIRTATSTRRDREAEKRLIDQLDTINRTLLSSAKKQTYSD